MTDSTRVVVRALGRRDPPMLGAVMIHGRLASSDAGVVYAGQLIDRPVVVVTLTDGAETDSFGRARFEQAVQAVIEDGSGHVAAADRAAEVSPWVAFAVSDDWDDALGVAHRVLAPVTLADIEPVGAVQGPQFRPHWYERRGTGRWRMWPLPWPGVLSAVGRWTFIAAFGLMVGIAALALWITALIFRHQPAPPPQHQRVQRTFLPPPPVTLPPTPTSPPSSTGGSGTPTPSVSGRPEPSIM